MIAQLTTVHPRTDIRIAVKECSSLATAFPGRVRLVVADGLGAAERYDLDIVDLGALPKARAARAMQGFLRAIRYLRATRPALVHFHDPELIPVGLVAKFLGLHVIYDVHEDVPRQILGRQGMSRSARLFLAGGAALAEWIGGRFFDALVAATPKIAERFPARKTVVIQNFPLLAELTREQSAPYAERPAVFVYMGALANQRGLREMVESVGRLNPDAHAQLELAGKFVPASLCEEAARYPGWGCVRLHGWLDRRQVADLLSRARAGLVLFHPAPNHVDSQPNKLFEYMSAGLPVIASRFPLWEQIVGRMECGLLVDPRDSAAIAGAMRWILENPVEAEEMGRRGRAAVESTFNWSSEKVKLIALYHRILGTEATSATRDPA